MHEYRATPAYYNSLYTSTTNTVTGDDDQERDERIRTDAMYIASSLYEGLGANQATRMKHTAAMIEKWIKDGIL